MIERNDGTTRTAVRDAASKYVTAVCDRCGPDHVITNVHVSTWETLHPCMPVRLLAIEATERHGAEVAGSSCARPDHIDGLPYTYRLDYRIQGVDADGSDWSEYERDSCEDVFEVVDRYALPGVTLTVTPHHAWFIEQPGALCMDASFRPVRSIEHLIVDATLPSQGLR